MSSRNRILPLTHAKELLASLSENFAVVQNPDYVFPPFDLYPLPPQKTLLDRGLLSAVMDMDGTTTTTEALCLHSLETMVRRLIDADDKSAWSGLNRKQDYPHVIGNSTTKHVEYLVRTYGNRQNLETFSAHFFAAAVWNYANRPERRAEILSTLSALGVEGILEETLPRQAEAGPTDSNSIRDRVGRLRKTWKVLPQILNDNDLVRAAIEVYYQEYHEILGGIAAGNSSHLAVRLFGTPSRRLIEPMKGVGFFLALIGGLLPTEAEFAYEHLADPLLARGFPPEEVERGRAFLNPLGAYFARHPVRVGLVTSSIEYEANIVLSEVFRILQRETREWEVAAPTRDRAARFFSDYRQTYGAVITATDSCEIRLKPHRDLYSLALSRLGVAPADFDRVIGFEDSESGTLAIRAAGIPLGVAVPFPETEGHTFAAASHIAPGGLPEVILLRHCYLPERLFR